jgi:hypothetical protein
LNFSCWIECHKASRCRGDFSTCKSLARHRHCLAKSRHSN